jgi:hypothetical protein
MGQIGGMRNGPLRNRDIQGTETEAQGENRKRGKWTVRE